jgi:hypothetical protein
MKPSIFAFGLIVLSLVATVTPALAHHSFAAEFDSDKPVTLTGFVTKIEWSNPHVWFYINVRKDDASVENWGFEMGPPHLLQATGWTRTTMKIGDEVTVNGFRAKNGVQRANARTVAMTATGQRLGAGSSQQQVNQ